VCSVWISEQTAIIFLYRIDKLISIIEMQVVHSAVRVVSKHNAVYIPSSRGYVCISIVIDNINFEKSEKNGKILET